MKICFHNWTSRDVPLGDIRNLNCSKVNWLLGGVWSQEWDNLIVDLCWFIKNVSCEGCKRFFLHKIIEGSWWDFQDSHLRNSKIPLDNFWFFIENLWIPLISHLSLTWDRQLFIFVYKKYPQYKTSKNMQTMNVYQKQPPIKFIGQEETILEGAIYFKLNIN